MRIKKHGRRIEAIAQPGWRGTIPKDVTQMTVAPAAADLDSLHAVAVVTHVMYVVSIKWFEEAGPAGARVEFRTRPKQGKPTQAAGILAVLVIVDEVSAKRPFGAAIQHHTPLLWRQGRSQTPAKSRA
jgi:hypothetical protein